MSPFVSGLVGIVLMFLLIFLRMPISFSMFVMGFLGLFYLTSLEAALGATALTIYSTFSNYTLTVVPLFILMGQLAFVSGMAEEVFQIADKWLRRLPGGLALATIGGCAAFASICGSSVGTAATLGSVALPEMKRANYDDSLATGSVAAGGTLGFLIPPSVGFVIYAILTEQSVGKLLMAGFFPGFLLAALWMLTIVVRIKLNPSLAPTTPGRVSWKERLWSLRNTWAVLLIFFLVMGGIYLGVVTPTEAGAVGATGLFLIALVRRRLTLPNLIQSLRETARITIMLLFIITGALVFSYFLAVSQIPVVLLGWIGELEVSRYVILGIIIFVLLLLGCIMDVGAMLVLTMPVLYPIVLALEFDPIWFGVIAVLMMNAGLITPPIGLNVYVTAGVAKDVPMATIFRGVLPFLIAIVLVSAIVTVFPQVALFLPSLML